MFSSVLSQKKSSQHLLLGFLLGGAIYWSMIWIFKKDQENEQENKLSIEQLLEHAKILRKELSNKKLNTVIQSQCLVTKSRDFRRLHILKQRIILKLTRLKKKEENIKVQLRQNSSNRRNQIRMSQLQKRLDDLKIRDLESKYYQIFGVKVSYLEE